MLKPISRTAVRRLIATAAIVAAMATTVPARSALPPSLVNSSVESGWASVTRLVSPRPQFNSNDPPAHRADGVVEFIATRWDMPLVADPTKSFITVTDVDGNIVPGRTLFDIVPGYSKNQAGALFYNYDRYAPYKGYANFVMTFRFEHGDSGGSYVVDHLTAGGAPYTIAYTATARNFNGSIGETVTLSPFTFGIDRRVAALPSITNPEVAVEAGPFGCPAPNSGPGCNTPLGQKRDPINVATPPPGSGVVIEGTVSDPLTEPFEEDPSARYLESSGIAAVIVRLYNGSTSPNSGAFRKSYYLPQSCTDTYPDVPSITRCPSTATFRLDLTPDLIARSWYAFDVYAIDLAGLHHPLVSSTERANQENLAGPETDSITFFYTG